MIEVRITMADFYAMDPRFSIALQIASLLRKRGIKFKRNFLFAPPTEDDVVPPWRYWKDDPKTGDVLVVQQDDPTVSPSETRMPVARRPLRLTPSPHAR